MNPSDERFFAAVLVFWLCAFAGLITITALGT
jgi:hypothetical protein